MSIKSIGIVLTACSATLAGHASLVGYQCRLRESWDRTAKAQMVDVVRAELAPLRGDVARAHDRIDQMLARKP
jgi:hypothetical protein